MAVVLTVDQRGSRRGTDRVEAALALLHDVETTRPFERTAGDEFQGLPADHLSVVTAMLDLVRDGHWSIGVGIGPVEEPLPAQTRAGRGLAFVRAREAVEAAKHQPQHTSVRGGDDAAKDVDAVLALLAVILRGRTPQAWEAIDLVEGGLTQAETASKLGITRQAVSQRLTAAHWREEQAARVTLERLLAAADPAFVP